MVGYSRLIEADEIGTLKRQKWHRKELIDPEIQRHGGLVVKSTGDGLLAEFPSVIGAVASAVAIQRQMHQREADSIETSRIRYRVGINLGDIVYDDDDIYGDGVNIAARLEQLAEPGGICISGTTYDHLKKQVDVGYRSLGEVRVKNIEHPIRTYEVLLDPADAGLFVEREYVDEHADPRTFAFEIPDKPSIAVLPFDNLSGDTEQDYLGDSITENIIAELSTSPDLMVIARNSAFAFKGKPTRVQEVAEQLGVRFVLEGSVQKAKDRIRIVAQLVDALKGTHLWAERYDYADEDIFAIQDDITDKISEEMEVKLALGEQARTWRREAGDLRLFRIASEFRIAFQKFNAEGLYQANLIASRLMEQEPDLPMAHSCMAWCHWFKAGGLASNRAENIALARDHVNQAASLAHNLLDYHHHVLLGSIEMFDLNHRAAIKHIDEARRLAPSASVVFETGGFVKVFSGEVESGVEMLRHAMRIEPVYPLYAAAHLSYGLTYLGQYDEARAIARGLIGKDDSVTEKAAALTHLIALSVFDGQYTDADRYLSQRLSQKPRISMTLAEDRMFFISDRDFVQRYLSALREAGLPE